MAESRCGGLILNDVWLDDKEWEEVLELPFADEWEGRRLLTRQQWLGVAYLALGKAEAIRRGRYDPEIAPGENEKWITDLEGIVSKIFEMFKPGGGKL